jgi:Sel1 repeat
MATTQLNSKQVVGNRIPPLQLAFSLTVLFGCFALLPVALARPRLEWSILCAAGALLIFQYLLRRQVVRTGRQLQYEFLARPVHYVQLMMHMSIYAYWGWYWREVYHQFPLIICQIVFTYILDMLVCWSRRDKWILGFGPFPIVLSTNLFLWFKSDWYFLQFLMLATIVLCKEFVTWKRDGRRVHIFNPSAAALFIFSVGLILTQGTNITWGEEIAVSQARPPYIFLEIFLLGLVVQALFSVTLVTLSAVATVYAMNLIYTHYTGVYYFVDANIPAAVFLGMHLLVTDPATSPRKNFGKIVFGASYGVGVFGFVWILNSIGVPPFYDKLLCVPPLNLTVRALDRLSAKVETRFEMPTWDPRRANLAFMAVWICLFAVMYRTGFLGSYHPGADPEFWRRACMENRPTACRNWSRQMKVFCSHGSATSCMALGIELDGGQMVPRDEAEAGKEFSHACELGSSNGCARLLRLVEEDQGQTFQTACNGGDGESCFLLGSLHFAGQGVPKDPDRAFALLQQSCTLGWPRGCSGLAECYRAGAGTTVSNDLAIQNFDKACEHGVASSCYSAYSMYRGANDSAKAEKRLRQGCEISAGFAESSAAYLDEGLSKRAATPAICSSFAK